MPKQTLSRMLAGRTPLTAELKATHQNLQESKSQVKALSHDKWILEQEKARLVADLDRLSENI